MIRICKLFLVPFALACGAFIGVATAAPLTLSVDNPLVDGRKLQPYTNTWHTTLIPVDGKPKYDAGDWTDKLELVEVNGRACWKRTQNAVFKRPDGVIKAFTKTVNVFDKQTFAAVSRRYERHVSGGQDLSLSLTFTGKHVRVETISDGVYTVNERDTDAAYDFNGGIYGVLFAAMPLTAGFSIKFPSYSEGDDPGKVVWQNASVTGSEVVDAGSKGKLATQIVSADSDAGPLKFWISKDPPYIIRLDYQATGGPRWIFETF